MKLLFTKNSLPLSWLIRWGLNEPVSHVAMEFDDKIIFHSNLRGVHLTFASNFRRKNEIVFEIPLPTTAEEEDASYFSVIAKREGKPWDFGAFFYWTWLVITRKVFRRPFPNVNPLASKKADLCTEILDAIPERFRVKNTDLALVSPFGTYLLVKEALERLKNDIVR